MIYDTTTGVPEPLPDTPDAEFACLVVSAQNAYSPNTERALRSDLRIYGSWCEGRGLEPFPAHPKTVATFVDDMAQGRAPATVRRYVASLARCIASPAMWICSFALRCGSPCAACTAATDGGRSRCMA